MLCARHTVEKWEYDNPCCPGHEGKTKLVWGRERKALIAAIEARDAALLHYNVEDIVRKPPPCPRCEEER